MRAPEAPIGWPSATAPPFTFTFSGSAPSSLRRVEHDRRERLVQLDALDVVDRLARPSRARSRRPSPACARGRRTRRRRSPATTIVASTSRPRSLRELLARDDERAAPSFTPGALPAVVVPSGSKTGFSARELLERRVAPRALVGGEVADGDDLVARSGPRRSPATARSCERSAQASCSSREMPSSRETNDACSTMCRLSKRRREPVVGSSRSISVAVAEPVAEARLLERRTARSTSTPSRR